MERRSDAALPSAEVPVVETGAEAIAGRRTSLAAFMLVLLFAGAADGLMEALGSGGFLLVCLPVMILVQKLTEVK